MAGTIPSRNGSAHHPVAVIGTGLFGTALAERLLADGFPVTVYNRTREKADPLLARGAKWSDNPLKECQRIIFSVYTTEQVAQILEQMHTGLEPGQIVLDTSTSDPRAHGRPGQPAAQDVASNISKRPSRVRANRRAIVNPRRSSPANEPRSTRATTCGIAWPPRRFTSAAGAMPRK